MKVNQFKYKVEKLIEGVKSRPALWDKSLEIYKDKEEKRLAWQYIFRLLEANYDQMSSVDRKTIADIITTKWTNIRDTFTRSMKNQSCKANTKKYIYHDEMSFLLKIIPYTPLQENASDVDEDPISCTIMLKQESSGLYDSEEEGSVAPRKRERERSDQLECVYRPAEPKPKHRKCSKKSDNMQSDDESQIVDYAEMGDGQDPRIMNEDEAFFASLLPTVVKYSEEERLEFRIEVLAVMKTINQNRKKPVSNYDSDN